MKNIIKVLRILLLLIMFIFVFFSSDIMRYSTIYCECVYESLEDIYAEIDINREYHHHGSHDEDVLDNYIFGDYRGEKIYNSLDISYFSTFFGKITLILFIAYFMVIIFSCLKFKKLDNKIKNNVSSIVLVLLSMVLLINQIFSFLIFRYNYCLINGELVKVFFTCNGHTIKYVLCNMQLLFVVLLTIVSVILLILNYAKTKVLNNKNKI